MSGYTNASQSEIERAESEQIALHEIRQIALLVDSWIENSE